MQTESEIIIIGAGASGLIAGMVLSRKFKVIILEGRDRCGGRINTRRDVFPEAFEEGAEFVHGKPSLTQELSYRFGLKRNAVEGRFYEFKAGKVSEERQEDQQWSRLIASLKSLEDDTDMQTVLDRNFAGSEFADLRQQVKAFAEGYDAADLTRVSAFALRDEWRNQDDENQSRFTSGYGELIRCLRGEFEDNGGTLRLATEVRNVRWSAGDVTVETSTGDSFRGRKLISTVPLGVLQQRRIAFVPDLPQHDDAFRKLGFGGVIKFFFRLTPEFRARFMNRFPGFSFIFSDARVPTWWSQRPSEIPVITGWMGGPSTFQVAGNHSALKPMALESLAYLVDCHIDEVANGIEASHIADWVNDPFSCGAYAYATVGSERVIEFITTPVSDTLYFAGEAFYQGPAMGTVEAALQSGLRVARTILPTGKL